MPNEDQNATDIVILGERVTNLENPVDDTTTPANTATPAGWIKVQVARTNSWIPYYQ